MRLTRRERVDLSPKLPMISTVHQERALRETPFGGTIAQRLLTLSMVSTSG